MSSGEMSFVEYSASFTGLSCKLANSDALFASKLRFSGFRDDSTQV